MISLSHGEQIYFAFHLQVHNNARRALQGQKNQLPNLPVSKIVDLENKAKKKFRNILLSVH